MRAVVLVPYFAVAATLGSLAFASPTPTGMEPSVEQMQSAFETALTRDVQNALEYAAETGGEAARAAIRDKGLDRFTIAGFRKHGCRPDEHRSGHVCEFSVDVDVVTGRMQRVLTGRFVGAATQLVFVQDI
jgi:hypothetical protein